MIKWLLRLAVLTALFLLGSYYLEVDVEGGKLIVAPRSVAERQKFWRALQPLLPEPQKSPARAEPAPKKPAPSKPASGGTAAQGPAEPRHEEVTRKDRQALDALLEEDVK